MTFSAIYGLVTTLNLFAWVMMARRASLTPPHVRRGCSLAMIATMAPGLAIMIMRGWLIMALLHGAQLGLWCWLYWKDRPPRDRRPQRAAGRVALIRGRLRVVPLRVDA